MILNFLTKVFGSKNERELKRLLPLVDRINALEPEIQALSDETLRAQTPRFKERLENGEPLDDQRFEKLRCALLKCVILTCN